MAASFVFKVAGSTYDRTAGYVQPVDLTSFAKDSWSSFRWMVPGGALPTGADPFRGKTISLDIDADFGAGSARRFTGQCVDCETTFGEFGWGRYYVANCLRWVGDKVPHTDSVTGLDSSQFNSPTDDPDSTYLTGRLGRTNGQILQAVLDMASNNVNLTAYGIGNYSSPGYGASATATVGGGIVTAIAAVAVGSGYTTAPNVYLNGGGGSGATATVGVAAGEITTFTITNAGTGYTSAPEVIISALPVATIRDLAQMTTVMPFPVSVGGEKLLDGIEGTMRSIAPNHMMRITPTGDIRFLDTRAFGGPTVGITDGTGSGASFTATVNSSGVVTGFVQVSGGTSYSGSPVITVTGGNGSGATGTAVVSAGVITSITLGSGGSGYSRPITLTLDEIDASGRQPITESLSFRASSEHCFSKIVVRGQPKIEGVWVGTATAPGGGGGTDNGLTEAFGHDSLTNTQAKAAWKLADYSTPDGSAGQATATCTVSAGAINAVVRTFGGFGYATAPTVHVSGGGGTGAIITATITSGVMDSVLTITNGGSGYTSAPTLSIDMPGGGNADSGTCTVPSSTTVTVTSIDNRKTWAANYWDQTTTGRQGVVYLVTVGSTGINTTSMARITSNTALTAGGTSTLTLDTTLPNTSYTAYRIVGMSGGGSIVWRRYSIVDTYAKTHLAPRFAYPVAVGNSDGSVLTLTSTPFVRILYSSSGAKPFYEVPAPASFDPVSGYVILQRPAVTYFGTTANLVTGGSSTDGIPSDVQAFLAVNKGTNTVTYPASGYSGTANSVDGLTDTLTVTVPSWRDNSNATAMSAYASELLDTVKDIAYDLRLEIAGLYEEFFEAGQAVNVDSSSGYTTGLEALNLPILEVSIKWNRNSSPLFKTSIRASNRRAHFTAERFLHPTPTGEFMNANMTESFTPSGGFNDQRSFTGGMGGTGQMDAFRDMTDGQLGNFGV